MISCTWLAWCLLVLGLVGLWAVGLILAIPLRGMLLGWGLVCCLMVGKGGYVKVLLKPLVSVLIYTKVFYICISIGDIPTKHNKK